MDTILLPLLDELRVELAQQLTDTLAGAPCVTVIQNGPQATADWCGCGDRSSCGMGWVRVDRIYASSAAFPAQDSKPGSCTAVLAASIELGAYRCAPVPNEDGRPPSPAAQIGAALEVTDDALAIARTFKCTPGITNRKSVLGVWTPRFSGDCHGGGMLATVLLTPARSVAHASSRPAGRPARPAG